MLPVHPTGIAVAQATPGCVAHTAGAHACLHDRRVCTCRDGSWCGVKKPKRRRFAASAVAKFQEVFTVTQSPDDELLASLAASTKETLQRVQRWFHNRRTRARITAAATNSDEAQPSSRHVTLSQRARLIQVFAVEPCVSGLLVGRGCFFFAVAQTLCVSLVVGRPCAVQHALLRLCRVTGSAVAFCSCVLNATAFVVLCLACSRFPFAFWAWSVHVSLLWLSHALPFVSCTYHIPQVPKRCDSGKPCSRARLHTAAGARVVQESTVSTWRAWQGKQG